MLPEAVDEKREEPNTVDLQQSDSAKLEKEAMNSIQHQSEELEKYLEPSNEPRFSLMKFLRRERRSGAEEEGSPSTSSDGGDNNGLPSYSEATSEAADTETAAVTVVDGATQTVEEEERNEDAADNDAESTLDDDQNESERTENPSTDTNTNSRPSFRIFSFLKK